MAFTNVVRVKHTYTVTSGLATPILYSLLASRATPEDKKGGNRAPDSLSNESNLTLPHPLHTPLLHEPRHSLFSMASTRATLSDRMHEQVNASPLIHLPSMLSVSFFLDSVQIPHILRQET